MSFIYDRTTLLNGAVDVTKYPNLTNQLSVQNILNRVVRMVLSDIDLRSTKRKAAAISFFNNEYEYTCPTDLKDFAIIDILPQKPRSLSERYVLVATEQFDRKKSLNNNVVTIVDADGTRRLRFSGPVDDTNTTVSSLDSTTSGGGTWEAFGNASTVASDTNNYVEGGGSLSFTLTSGGTTAGIVNSTLTAIDISSYVADGSLFLWTYIVDTSNVTNFIIRIGSSSSNYHQITVTTQADSSAFAAGWNLLQFKFVNDSPTGTPVDTTTNYVAMYMTKSSGKTGTLYRFDGLQIHTGEYAQVVYYSGYGWQTQGGTYIENSTATSDYIVALSDEMPLYEAAIRREVYRELREYNQMTLEDAEYQKQKQIYIHRAPSERLNITSSYWS